MSTKDPALVQLVSSRYRELQGLRTAALAGTLLAGGVGFWLGIWIEGASPSLAGGAVLAAYTLWYFARLRAQLERYYANRFGRVGKRVSSSPVILWLVFGAAFARNAISPGAPTGAAIGLVLILMAVPSAWIAIRDRPFRTHWLLVTAVGVLAAFQIPVAPSARAAWEALAWCEAGLAVAIAGVCDHRILVRTLTGVSAEDAASEPVR